MESIVTVPKYLIDTVILVDHLNGVEKATKWLSRLGNEEGAISVITRAEVLVGTTSHELDQVVLLLNQYSCLSITIETADLCAQLRQKHHWKLPDAFQAALALEHHLFLVTRNTKDFREKEHGFVKIPYHL